LKASLPLARADGKSRGILTGFAQIGPVSKGLTPTTPARTPQQAQAAWQPAASYLQHQKDQQARQARQAQEDQDIDPQLIRRANRLFPFASQQDQMDSAADRQQGNSYSIRVK
jgi:hypothetical protein